MSGTEKLVSTGLTRRSFLKTTGAVAGVAAVATFGLQGLAEAEEYVAGQNESSEEKIFHGICRGNCSGTCKLNMHVRDGRIVKTSKRPFKSVPDGSLDRICSKGLSHPYNIYSPDRLKYPLRRVGERGAGQW
ncbi:MAG: twin-arginine translocation signal domain-containing protein, partial [Raoultibacter sp.]